jgi:hypothetical protein
MSVYTRRVLFLSLIVALTACSAAGGGTATPSAGYTHEVAGGHEVFRPLSIRPNANSPAILINFVSNGPAQGGVPCIACVSGAQSNDNVGLTGPSSYVPTGSVWQYALSFTDLTYKGKCKLAWTITAGKKTIDSFSTTLKLTSSGGFVLYGVDRNRPKYSGAATLTGQVTCGEAKPSLQVPLEFE